MPVVNKKTVTVCLPSVLSTDQILLVKAALWPANEALAYWQDWKRYHRIDETVLLKDAELLPKIFDPIDYDSQMLMSQVYHNLQHTSDPLMPRLRGFYRYTWFKSESAWQVFNQVVSALQQRSIEPVWLQGSSLRAAYSQNLGGRRLQDAALYISPEQRSATFDTLRKLGLQAFAQTRWEDMLSYRNAHKQAVLIQRTILPFSADKAAEQSFFAQLERITLPDSVQALILPSTHQVFCGLVWAFWQRATPHPGRIADCVAVALQHDIDWTIVVQLAQQHNSTYAVAEGLNLLVNDFAIQLTSAQLSLLNNLSVNTSQQRYHQFLKSNKESRTIRQKIYKARLVYDAYYKNGPHSFPIWFLRKVAIRSVRQLIMWLRY